MLHILLSPTDGGTAWRHLLAPDEARAGFEPAGPMGLTRRLGRILGIPAELATGPERLASYTQRLDRHDDGTRSYSVSRKQDPFGVARYLLTLRDALLLAGWDGSALQGSDRMRDLSALEQVELPLPPGLPELIVDLLAGLKAIGPLPFPVHVELTCPRRDFTPLLRRLLDAMAASGAVIVEATSPTPIAPGTTDLGRLQRALLAPASAKARLTGDGSFLLLEADTPIEAAELTASLARTRPLADTTFVVPTESACLDAAMARQGLPTLGRSSSSHLRPHLQVLPLRLALAFGPQDPFRAAELLLLPGAPLPGHVRRKLLGALSQMPGIGSPEWKDAIETSVTDEVRYARERGASETAAEAEGIDLRTRIEAWFGGELFDPVTGIPAAKAAALASVVATWAGGRVRGSIDVAAADPDSTDPGDASLWAHAGAVARTLEHLLIARPPGERMSQQLLLQLHETAVGDGSDLAAFPGESGRPALVGAPGGVTAPSAGVVWWGFVLDADQGPGPEPWTAAERDALSAQCVTLPVPGERRSIEAEGWRRPVLAAREQVVLVRWRLAGVEPVPAHALLDEISTRVEGDSLTRCTISSERLLAGGPSVPWKASVVSVAPTTLMSQRPTWSVPAATLLPSGSVSASSLGSYIGCPFQWALHYQAKLRRGEGVDLPVDNRLLGDFTHRILQDMLCGPSKLAFATATEGDARTWATTSFSERVGVEAASLVRRGAEVELERARTLVGNAAASLLSFLQRTGWKPVDAEREVKGTFADLPAAGFIDLVVEKGGNEALVDLKLSGLKYRQEELESGHALQTALYASMLRKKGKPLPPSGFFILEDGQLLTTEPLAFPGAIVVDGPGPAATLEGAAEGFQFWRSVMAKGVLPVLHEELAWEGPVTAAVGPPPTEGSIARPPTPCKFCDFASLCVPPAFEDEEEES